MAFKLSQPLPGWHPFLSSFSLCAPRLAFPSVSFLATCNFLALSFHTNFRDVCLSTHSHSSSIKCSILTVYDISFYFFFVFILFCFCLLLVFMFIEGTLSCALTFGWEAGNSLQVKSIWKKTPSGLTYSILPAKHHHVFPWLQSFV